MEAVLNTHYSNFVKSNNAVDAFFITHLTGFAALYDMWSIYVICESKVIGSREHSSSVLSKPWSWSQVTKLSLGLNLKI